MRAGDLTETIEVYRATTSTDATGAEESTLTRLYSCRAKVKYGNGYRSVVNDEIVISISYYFTVRYAADAQQDDIVVYQGRKYRVTSVKPDRTDQSKELTCEEVNE